MLSAKNISEKEWNNALEDYPEANFLQSYQWKKLHNDLNMKTNAVAFCRDDKIVGVALIVIKDAKRGRYAEVSAGPLMNWEDEDLAKFVTQQIKKIAKKENAVFTRIRPQLLKSVETEGLFAKLGYKKAPMHLHAEHTSILDLSQSEEEILKNMRRQTRYEVRKADKLNITVEHFPAQEKIDQFIALQNETARRQGFVTSSETFLKTLATTFENSAQIYVSSINTNSEESNANVNDAEVLNMGLILKSGQEADYFEAASSEMSYSYPGAYGLLWQAIKDTKNEGYKRFNFWGISYNNDPHNRYAGVTTFKKGFGGESVTYMPAQDLIINPVKYSLDWLIETVRRKKRRL